MVSPDYNSRSGVSDRTIGDCPSRRELLSVITVTQEDGTVFGINAWESNTKDKRIYRERNEGR
ncbi:Conserved protein of uncharacterised function%2C possible IS sequence associated protein [Mycobacterium tuberculosis]|nr:Conserved protein of uncharacterised function%2C possible IS sequence associated protein [Mycobacterium tuberculosis]